MLREIFRCQLLRSKTVLQKLLRSAKSKNYPFKTVILSSTERTGYLQLPSLRVYAMFFFLKLFAFAKSNNRFLTGLRIFSKLPSNLRYLVFFKKR